MSAAYSAREAAVRIRMIQMEAAIVTPLVMPDPSTIRLNVGSVWMALGIAEVSSRLVFRARGSSVSLRRSRRTVFRDVTAAYAARGSLVMSIAGVCIAGMLIFMLCEDRQGG
jgi:hypothetical protein